MRETWRHLIDLELDMHGETWADVVAATPSINRDWIDRFGFAAYGNIDFAFTVWTSERVYFPACYDGTFWCASAPRKTCGEPVEPVGGG